jgi:mRNA interferase HicA
MIKRVDLERHLKRHGCSISREGGKHAVWRGPEGSASTLPRHREVPRGTARAICRQLGVPEIT